jgi:hypothetical protein
VIFAQLKPNSDGFGRIVLKQHWNATNPTSSERLGKRAAHHHVTGVEGMPWLWEITARPESTQNRGYAVSCEQAMREFKARWANPARF